MTAFDPKLTFRDVFTKLKWAIGEAGRAMICAANVAAVVLAGLVQVAAPAKAGATPPEDMMFGNAGYELSASEIARLGQAGLYGDGKAAFRLSLYYRFARPNSEKLAYWVEVAAEDGNPNAEYTYGFDLSRRSDENANRRAIFWLKKALKDGVPLAASLLEELRSGGAP